jgi:hypothetical protein
MQELAFAGVNVRDVMARYTGGGEVKERIRIGELREDALGRIEQLAFPEYAMEVEYRCNSVL